MDSNTRGSGSGPTATLSGSKRADNNVQTPYLDKFGRDLTKLAAQGKISPAVGRDKELSKLAQALSRKTKSNAVLVGHYGVGKTAIVEQLAISIVNGSCPSALTGKRLVELSLSTMISGTKFRGQFESRLTKVIEEVTDSNIILFIDEIHTIMGLGASGGTMDASNILKPALARGEIKVIGATTTREFTELEKDGAFKRRFMKIQVDEPGAEDTANIIKNIKSSYEKFHNILIGDEVVNEIVKASRRYITDRFSPDREIDLIDLIGAKNTTVSVKVPQSVKDLNSKIIEVTEKKLAAIKSQDYELAAEILIEEKALKSKYQSAMSVLFSPAANKTKPITITKDNVYDMINEITGIDVKSISKQDNDRLSNLEEELSKSVIGQDKAIQSLCKGIRRSRCGISKSTRPEFVGFFLGPTGTGKTHICKKLSELLYDTNKSFIKIDMSEYMDPSAITKLIGSPPSFVGYEDNNHVFEKIRNGGGRFVLLLDEFEKAHPRIVNLFLQIFDEGKCHDSKGNEIDFRNTVIVMTSNLGIKKLVDFGTGIGFNTSSNNAAAKDAVLMKELKSTYAPEVINRFDEIVIFNSLTQEDVKRISDIAIQDVIQRAAAIGYNLVVEDNMREHIVSVGFDEEFGGRYLNRAITSNIEDNFATFVFKNSPAENSTITISWEGEDKGTTVTAKKKRL